MNNLGFKWSIASFKGNQMLIKLVFDNPLEISKPGVSDNCLIIFYIEFRLCGDQIH
jgi:hypothetical protein